MKDLKIKFTVDERISLDGTLPSLEGIPSENSILCLDWNNYWNVINNFEFFEEKRKGIAVSDITSAAFIYDIPWKVNRCFCFSW